MSKKEEKVPQPSSRLQLDDQKTIYNYDILCSTIICCRLELLQFVKLRPIEGDKLYGI